MIGWLGLMVFGVSLVLSLLATPMSRRVALRLGMFDTPTRHKAHSSPVPLLGGSAIFLAIVAPMVGALAIGNYWAARGAPAWLGEAWAVHIPGLASRTPEALGILAAATALHVMGLLDDRKAMGPWWKLLVQLLAAAAVVLFCGVRILTVAGPTLSIIASILWLVVITNAFNFLDNMDGLAAGVAAIVAAALLVAAGSLGQLFVVAMLCMICGAVLGFLPLNFPPAKTFMGDAGSLVIGFLLAVASAQTTYIRPGQAFCAYGVLVPFVVMALPLYDVFSVVTLRIKEGRSPMVGDRRHFSHRLVRRGMTVRTALLTIYLCTAATAIAAMLLARVDTVEAVLIFAQTLAVLGVLAMLEFGDARP